MPLTTDVRLCLLNVGTAHIQPLAPTRNKNISLLTENAYEVLFILVQPGNTKTKIAAYQPHKPNFH